MKFNQLSLTLLLCLFFFQTKAATVDSLDVPSVSMKKTYKAAVVLPTSYSKNTSNYPVLYLLHGADGHFRSWLIRPNNTSLVQNMADMFDIIIVLPEGEAFGWYLDSPILKENQFESYIIKDVIPKVDENYRTQPTKSGRAISGLSMGGHGALYLATRHPDLFCAAGSMSGALDMNFSKYKVDSNFMKTLREKFKNLLGTDDYSAEIFKNNSVMNMIENIKINQLPLLIECGVDDFLLDVNREFHSRLVYQNIPHDYTERPGGHTWVYWENALPYHMIFFQNIFKNMGTLREK